MASLQTADGSHFCGGSVVARRWVLTAAHCSEDTRPGTVRVVVGKNDLTARGGQTLRVDRIRIHPDWARTGTSDVALWHVTRRIAVRPIALVRAGQTRFEQTGFPLTVAGWGTEAFGSPITSDTLKEVGVEAVADDDCTVNQTLSLRPRTEMCAGALGGDSCQGDSGGPLFATVRGRPVQVGAVSYGFACAVPEVDGVYAQLSARSVHRFVVRTIG